MDFIGSMNTVIGNNVIWFDVTFHRIPYSIIRMWLHFRNGFVFVRNIFCYYSVISGRIVNIVRAVLFGVHLSCLMEPRILFSRPLSGSQNFLGRNDLVIIEFIETLDIKIGAFLISHSFFFFCIIFFKINLNTISK